MPNPVYFFGYVGLFADPIEYILDLSLLSFQKFFKTERTKLIWKSWTLFTVASILVMCNTEIVKGVNSAAFSAFPDYSGGVRGSGFCLE